jgi:hypothetical protein
LVIQYVKNDVIKGQASWAWGQANSTGMPPNQKVNKSEELTYLTKNIVFFQLAPTFLNVVYNNLQGALIALGRLGKQVRK